MRQSGGFAMSLTEVWLDVRTLSRLDKIRLLPKEAAKKGPKSI